MGQGTLDNLQIENIPVPDAFPISNLALFQPHLHSSPVQAFVEPQLAKPSPSIPLRGTEEPKEPIPILPGSCLSSEGASTPGRNTALVPWLSHGPCLTYKMGRSCFCPATSRAEPESDHEVPARGTTQPGDPPPGLRLFALVSGPLHRVNFYGGYKILLPTLVGFIFIQVLTQQKGKTQLVLRVTWDPGGTTGVHGGRDQHSANCRGHSCPLPLSMGPNDSLTCHFHSAAQHPSCPDLLAMLHAQKWKAPFLQLVLRVHPWSPVGSPPPTSVWVPQAWGSCVLKPGVVKQGLTQLQPQSQRPRPSGPQPSSTAEPASEGSCSNGPVSSVICFCPGLQCSHCTATAHAEDPPIQQRQEAGT